MVPHERVRGAWSDSAGPRTKKRRLLLSPPTSSSSQPEHNHRLREPNVRDLDNKSSQSAPESFGKEVESEIDVVDRCNHLSPGRKRKRRFLDEESLKNRPQFNPGEPANNFLTVEPESADGQREGRDIWPPTEYWARTGWWPENFSSMSQDRSDPFKKRGRTPSYAQSFKDGEVPRAYSPAFENVLAEYGVRMEESKGRSLIGQASKEQCAKLLLGRYPDPPYTLFPLSEFLSVWQRAQNRNEGRIYRDITPLLVPSAELLTICGQQDLEHVTEEISAEWTKSKTLGGPKPKPDLAVGIAQSAFTEEEIAKLKNHTAFERSTLFTDHLYFPFLLCEAKCGDQGINRADRQNMHSSSMAVNAIIQLHGEEASKLSGQVLVISISHDNERVKIYGHFAVIHEEQTTFYRFFIASFVLNYEESQGRKRTHDFVREIYNSFYPEHLERIRNALAEMDDPRAHSMTTSMNIEERETQELETSASSSQEPGFKKPNAPASKKQRGEMALLREQLAQQEKQSMDQMAFLDRQIAKQEKQYKEQTAQQERHFKEQMAQQEKQMAQQEKQMAQQEKQMAQQEKHFKEQIEMLKGLLGQR